MNFSDMSVAKLEAHLMKPTSFKQSKTLRLHQLYRLNYQKLSVGQGARALLLMLV